MPPSQRLSRLLRPLLFAVGLGGLGALVNYLLLSPLPSPVLYLGGLFYLPVLIRFGFSHALLCSTLTQLPLLSTLAYWLPLPELIALAWLIHRRRLAPMRAALLYWLSAGLACTVFIAFQLDDWDLPTRLMALAIPPLSGLVLMALTSHTLAAFRNDRPDDGHPIADQLSNLLVVFACMPILLFHVLGTPSFTREQINKTLRTIRHAEQVSEERYQLLIERNLRGLSTIAEVISVNHGTPLSDFEPLLNRLVGNLPEVITVILIDQQGIAVAGAPSHFPDGASVKEARQSYQDRSYFQEARLKPEPIVSYGIIGRRMNKEPLLSLVAPIVNAKQEFTGLLLGNLPVRRLQSVFDAIEHRERFDALLYDRKQQILYSTDGLASAPLAPLAEQTFFARLSADGIPTELSLGSRLQSHLWRGKLLHHHRYAAGDGMVLAYDLRPDMAAMARNSLLALLLMLGLILAARRLSQQVSKHLLSPLLSLHHHLQTLDPARVHQLQPLQIDSPTREFSELIRSVNSMMIRIAKARPETDWAIAEKDKLNADLDRKIAERTEQLASKAEQLERLSITDALTGLHNRRYLNDQLTDEWQRSRRGQNPFTLMLLDVDHFKSINDRYGHPVGDEVLRQIGVRLLEKIRSIDMAARYGGEEFAVLLPGIDASHALVVAERLRLCLADELVSTDSGTLHFTVSIGICDSLSAELTSESDLLQRVDQALYSAKRNGRNRCLIWNRAG